MAQYLIARADGKRWKTDTLIAVFDDTWQFSAEEKAIFRIEKQAGKKPEIETNFVKVDSKLEEYSKKIDMGAVTTKAQFDTLANKNATVNQLKAIVKEISAVAVEEPLEGEVG